MHLVTLAPGVFNPLNPGQVIDGLDLSELEIVTITGTDYVKVLLKKFRVRNKMFDIKACEL